jgi:hypothetical protein
MPDLIESFVAVMGDFCVASPNPFAFTAERKQVIVAKEVT